MDALRKQASKLREQVAKQQQAVIKQFSASGYESSEVMVIDEIEMQTHQQLEKLYRSTRSGRVTILLLLSMNHCMSFLGMVLEPLRAMMGGSPLEDARHLAQRYSKMRQDAEAQAVEISRRQARVRESPIPENVAKLHAAESRMHELKANMAVLGKEAAAALAAVESQQQRLTFQRLVAMVEGERIYHERVATILGNIEAEIVSDKQRKEAAPPVTPLNHSSEKTKYFLAEATHPFDAASEKELSLAVGDYIVVRKVNPSGWSEGECKGRAGWFPTAYVEKRQRIPTNYTAADVY
ncbi:SH3 domain-containing protein 3-like [Olea europaea var. sylvestris]|uniref:SH3 domain-containing protein 3-like n=1 Tax=Olea europaea var. sylvestris TaxID=158386 RepID=UPI000C1D26DB|nr:SH3 domain-containing protein 3-like [Olea europaea var. sylvestris]